MKGRIRSLAGRISLLLILLLLPAGGRGAETGAILSVPEGPIRPWEPVLIRYTLPRAGTVNLTLTDDTGRSFFTVARNVEGIRGQNSLYWNGTYQKTAAPDGMWLLTLDTGDETVSEPVRVENPGDPESGLQLTPAAGSPWEGRDRTMNYWTLPMNIHYEEAIWQVLMSPITVVDSGNGEKAQVTVRAEPSADGAGVGVVTCLTQGVHVLERGEEWTLIECYSSSFHDSKVLNWNALIQGYVPTRFLREEIPNQELGMVVDKLTQRLYVFREGRLFSTLEVSTGLTNRRQPYNETRSGEFLLTSKTGGFQSDNMYCPLAIRFNSGDLLHEVPYIQSQDGSRSYAGTESRLGAKASHGCIRVPRKASPEGVNMQWIWDHLAKNSKTRLLIWEDWQGRQIEIPRDDLRLYYNPASPKVYHVGESCSGVKEGTELASFTYGQLEEKKFAKMKRCEYCAPPLRREAIEKINAKYAAGGDHDPVMTNARKSCPKKGK